MSRPAICTISPTSSGSRPLQTSSVQAILARYVAPFVRSAAGPVRLALPQPAAYRGWRAARASETDSEIECLARSASAVFASAVWASP